jgi:hypothetical protein
VDVGQRTEAIVLAELVKRGHKVLVPFGTNHRYDFVVDTADGFLFLIHCPQTDRVYALEVEEAASGIGALRVAPTANSQAKGVRWAADYELPA